MINEGLISAKEIFRRMGTKREKTTKYEFQELALRIIEELEVKERGLIFKICRDYPKPFVEHCFNETKERAKGQLRSHYFIKLIYAK